MHPCPTAQTVTDWLVELEILVLTGAEEPDGLVDPPEWGHVNGLPPHCPCPANTCGVLTWATVGYGVHQHLQGVLHSR